MNLTAHFTDAELGVAGCDQRLIDNATCLCQQILEPVRLHYGLPVRIHDGYRDPGHNDRVGGKPASFHLYEQDKAAADFDVVGMDCRSVFDWMRLSSGLPFDKVILETSHGIPRCVHVQVYAKTAPRRLAYIGETGAATNYVPQEVRDV